MNYLIFVCCSWYTEFILFCTKISNLDVRFVWTEKAILRKSYSNFCRTVYSGQIIALHLFFGPPEKVRNSGISFRWVNEGCLEGSRNQGKLIRVLFQAPDIEMRLHKKKSNHEYGGNSLGTLSNCEMTGKLEHGRRILHRGAMNIPRSGKDSHRIN